MPVNIGYVIRALRKDKGWSQEKLALETELATSDISRIERGERRLPTSRLEEIANALSVSAADIYAIAEGRQGLPEMSVGEDHVSTDLSSHMLELRNTVRKLTSDERRLVSAFARMLLRHRRTGEQK